MNKYLILNFKNAKLFRKLGNDYWKYGKDFSFSRLGGVYFPRNEMPCFIEPITVHQISNMIHVLFNERPISSLRENTYERNEYYFNKAENSYIKIETPKIHYEFIDKKTKKLVERDEYYYETVHTKKAVYDSYSKTAQINWEVVKAYIGDIIKFNMFVDQLNSLFNIDSKIISVYDVKKIVINSNPVNRLKLYDSIKKLKNVDGLIYFFGRYVDGKFQKPDSTGLTCKYANCSAKTVNNGIELAIILNGKIIVPVNDEDINKLATLSKGFARILDGGLVSIDSIKSENDLNVDEYAPVSTISTETKLFN